MDGLAQYHIDGLVQDCSNSIANAMELLQSVTRASILTSLLMHWSYHSVALSYPCNVSALYTRCVDLGATNCCVMYHMTPGPCWSMPVCMIYLSVPSSSHDPWLSGVLPGLILALRPANKRRRYKSNAVSHWLGAKARISPVSYCCTEVI